MAGAGKARVTEERAMARSDSKDSKLLAALGLKPSSIDTRAATLTDSTKPLDTRKAPAFPFKDGAKFIAISTGLTPVHEIEDGKFWIAAVGIATLDTKDLLSLSPSKDGCHWADEVQTKVISIIGRDEREEAAALTDGTLRERISFEDFKSLVGRCFGVDGHIVLLSDSMEDKCTRLEAEVGRQGLEGLNNMVSDFIDVLQLPKDAPAYLTSSSCPETLAKLCKELGITTGNMRNVGNRAEYIMQAMLAIAVRAAPAATQAAYANAASAGTVPVAAPTSTASYAPTVSRDTASPAPATSNARPPPPIRQQPSIVSSAEEATTTAATTSSTPQPPSISPSRPAVPSSPATPVQPAAAARLSSARTPAASTTSSAASTGPLAETSNAKAQDRPNASATAFVSPYDQPAFTADDASTVRVTQDEIYNLPRRIFERVAKYTLKTQDLETELISVAAAIAYPGLSDVTETYTPKGTRSTRTKIAAPITNFEKLTAHITRTRYVPGRFIDSLKEIIALRAFVSNWYGSLPGITAQSLVAQKTEQHLAFVAMLRRLLPVMEQRRQA
ncbi:hypothetical protein LTR85_000272 [Meristemomyces frigidus]|nr:hypothetical protein LTR85_000272 [Meristemomyces frigidus]